MQVESVVAKLEESVEPAPDGADDATGEDLRLLDDS
jgi:hypothetical protein